ncbi:hypothetical protein VaNZ11_013068, partial [Volvox africanus]
GGGTGGVSPALSTNNLEDLAADNCGGGGAHGGGGGGHHVSFAALPPRPPPRTRSNASMPDITTGPTTGGGGGGSSGAAAAAAANGHGGVGGGTPGSAGGGGGGSHPASRSQSCADINTAVAAMARFGSGPRVAGGAVPSDGHSAYGISHLPHLHPHLHHVSGHVSGRASPSVRSTTGTLYGGGPTGPYMGKLESIASSAV